MVGVAFFPDDKFYHNRTLLALEGHRWMIIEGMYTPTQGFIGGPRVNMEIDCLREVLYCDTEIWKVMDPRRGRERDYFMTKREAEAFITSKKMVMRGKGGLVPFDMQPNLHCVVEQGTKLMLRPEILSIIRSHQRDQYGWTGCDEYKKVVVSKMNALIAKRGDAEDSRPQVQAGVENQVLEILSRLDLTPDQLAKLKSTKRPEAPVAQVDTGASGDIDPDDIPPASEDVDDDPNPTVQDHTQVREAAVTYTSADLWKKKNDDLKAIATGLGISTEDFVRKEAVESILNIQGTPAQAETVLN